MSISQNYPNTAPALLIDLANTQKLDPRIAFTRASTGTFYDANGLLRTAPDNFARFQFDPVTGVSEGLLRENQATNLVLRSEEFDNAGWTKTGATVESNVAIAPDGTLTMDKLISNSGSVGQIRQVISLGVVTVSIFAKAAEFEGIRFGALGNGGIATFNLSTGLVTSTSGTTSSASMVNVGNGIYRCVATWNQTANNTLFFDHFSFGTGDGFSGIFIWGAQLEANSFATSYIKTVASQVTRAADIARLTNVDAYNTAEFTAVSKPFGVSGVSATQTVLNGDVPIERLYVYPRNLPQDQINTLVENDGYWSWRIVGADFALPNFTTDGTVIVDWGDGTEETLTTAVHTFTNASPHTVRFRMGSGTTFRPSVNNNATHRLKVVALGSVPSNMIVDCSSGFFGCTNLKSIDATLIGGASFNKGWQGCSSLTSFPFINTSSGTNFSLAWISCPNLQYFPLIDTSNATDFGGAWSGCSSLTLFPAVNSANVTTLQNSGIGAWQNCSSLTEFPLIDLSLCTNFSLVWSGCTSLTSFPAIDTSSGTNFSDTWNNCNKLTSFPLLDMSLAENLNECWDTCSSLTSFPAIDFPVCTNFTEAWRSCSSLTAFPLININLGTTFNIAWQNCTSLTDFPAGMFDSWTGVPVANCFLNTWAGTTALTTTSVENILVSIDTSGVSAPATGTEITISYNVSTGALTAPTTAAITSLQGKNWTIKINGVLQ